MIESRRLKRLVAQLVLLAGALLALGAILVATHVVSFSSTSADPGSALHVVAELPPEADALVSWAPDVWNQERVLEPATRIALEAAYVRAWAALGVFQATGTSTALITMFSGPARLDALAVPAGAPIGTWSVAHRLRLEFYALDGATVALTDTGAHLVRAIGTGAAEAVVDSAETYSVVMVLEDGYWRIRQLRRLPGSTTTVTTRSPSGTTSVLGGAPVSPVPVPTLNATDYAPIGWPNTAQKIITADLSRARDLGLTAIRVRIPFDQLTSPASLARLPELLNGAQAVGLRVILVLADGQSDLSPASWGAADHGAAAVAATIGNNPALALWDIADRPDLRASVATDVEIDAYVVHAATSLHLLTPSIPVTVSWSDPALAGDPELATLVDVVSLHWTAAVGDLSGAIEQTQAGAGPRPVLVVATTTPTDGGWSPRPHSERRQAVEIAEVLLSTDHFNVTRTAIDRLRDSSADRGGLLRADDTNEPGAALLVPGVSMSSISGPGWREYAASNFWRAAALGALIVGILAVLRWVVIPRRTRRRVTVRTRHARRAAAADSNAGIGAPDQEAATTGDRADTAGLG